ncbi:MAG: hypothetical protein GWN00_20000 [Aliifodinibius sp.]|nr:hypothetical protein [Fodinibius sp.]NIY27005.1 hypothetical protein [Fodinibius sp.]
MKDATFEIGVTTFLGIFILIMVASQKINLLELTLALGWLFAQLQLLQK